MNSCSWRYVYIPPVWEAPAEGATGLGNLQYSSSLSESLSPVKRHRGEPVAGRSRRNLVHQHRQATVVLEHRLWSAAVA